jgi:hypothetical protein
METKQLLTKLSDDLLRHICTFLIGDLHIYLRDLDKEIKECVFTEDDIKEVIKIRKDNVSKKYSGVMEYYFHMKHLTGNKSKKECIEILTNMDDSSRIEWTQRYESAKIPSYEKFDTILMRKNLKYSSQHIFIGVSTLRQLSKRFSNIIYPVISHQHYYLLHWILYISSGLTFKFCDVTKKFKIRVECNMEYSYGRYDIFCSVYEQKSIKHVISLLNYIVGVSDKYNPLPIPPVRSFSN